MKLDPSICVPTQWDTLRGSFIRYRGIVPISDAHPDHLAALLSEFQRDLASAARILIDAPDYASTPMSGIPR